MSQKADEDQRLQIKHGNDVEYDADFIFFVLAFPKKENGKVIKDDMGQVVIDTSRRAIKCMKNRQDERLFMVYLEKHEIITTKPKEYIFEG